MRKARASAVRETDAQAPDGGRESRMSGMRTVVPSRGRTRIRARSVLRLNTPPRPGGSGRSGSGGAGRRPAQAGGRRAATRARFRADDAPGNGRAETPGPPADILDSALNEHIRKCAPCKAREQLRACSLLTLAPAPEPSEALRRRVLHTATDPELAGYRADIAARGGALTPEGLPTQPDVPSPFARRWMFATGGMGGALLTALAVIVFMGSQLGVPTFDWPYTHPNTTRTQAGPPHHSAKDGGPEGPGGDGDSGPVPPSPQLDDPSRPPTSDPGKTGRPPVSTPPTVPTSPPGSPRPGTLRILTTKLELYGRTSGTIRLKAVDGPVTWTGASSSTQVTLQDRSGGLSPNGSRDLLVTLHTGLINLPGRAKLTFTTPHGPPQEVTVVWGISLL